MVSENTKDKEVDTTFPPRREGGRLDAKSLVGFIWNRHEHTLETATLNIGQDGAPNEGPVSTGGVPRNVSGCGVPQTCVSLVYCTCDQYTRTPPCAGGTGY